MPELRLQDYRNRHSRKSKLKRAVWNGVWFLLFRPTPRGNGFRRWRAFLLRCFGATIGKGCYILPDCRIWQPWKLELGDYSWLSQGVDCYAVDSIKIGSQCVISQDAFLCTASHDISSPIFELTTRPITIENQVWVGARAIILPGITLHEGCVVAAGAVVTKDVPAWTIVGGNPAKPIGTRHLSES